MCKYLCTYGFPAVYIFLSIMIDLELGHIEALPFPRFRASPHKAFPKAFQRDSRREFLNVCRMGPNGWGAAIYGRGTRAPGASLPIVLAGGRCGLGVKGEFTPSRA